MMDGNATSSNIESTFTVLQDAGAITLLEPASEEVIPGDSVWLNWSAEYTGDAALTFDLVVDTIPDPVKYAARSVAGNSYFVEDLEDGETYYWKVISLLDGSPASWGSDIRSFDIVVQGIVTLLLPEDGALMEGYSVKLEWDWEYHGTGEVTFEVHLGNTEGSLNVLGTGITETSVYAWDLEDGKMYYWEVTPLLNGTPQSTISERWSFTVEFPGRIDLFSPSDGGIVEGPEAVLEWNFSYNGTGDLEFNVYLDTKKEPDTLQGSALDTNSTLIKDLMDARKYYWKVTPVLNGNEREWSSGVFSFTTRFSGTVDLRSPENEQVLGDTEVLLEWELDYEGSGVITFSVFMDENAEPETKILSRSPRTNHTEDNLIRGNTYYWYVQPCLDDEEVSWRSEIRNFTVGEKGNNGPDDDDNGKEDNDDDNGVKNGSNDGKGDSSKGGRTLVILIASISIVLLISVIIFVLVILRRRKDKEEQDEVMGSHGQNTFAPPSEAFQPSYPPQVSPAQYDQYPYPQQEQDPFPETVREDQFFGERLPDEYR